MWTSHGVAGDVQAIKSQFKFVEAEEYISKIANHPNKMCTLLMANDVFDQPIKLGQLY